MQPSKHLPVILLMQIPQSSPFEIMGLMLLPFMLIRILTLTLGREEQSVICLCLVTENTFISFYQENREKTIFTLPSLSTLGIS